MSGDENPYASPRPLDDESAPAPSRAPHVFLASFLGMQAGGMLGLVSACFAPLRYLLGPIPLDAVLMEDLSGNVRVQVIGESIFVMLSCLVIGMTFGAVCELSDKFFWPLRGEWFLLSSLKVRRLSYRGLEFAIVAMAPAFLILLASYSKRGGYFWLHGLWAVMHFLIALYFGERFADACRRATRTT